MKSFNSIGFIGLIAFPVILHGQERFSHGTLEAEKVLEEMVEREDIIGASISVGYQDQIVFSQGFGLMDKDLGLPTQPDTKFRIYSVSKHITAAAIAKLWEDKKLELDSPISKYLPLIDQKLKNITTRQLVGHTSGVRAYREGEWQLFSNAPCSNPFEAMWLFGSDSLLFQPGEKFEYTTYGYVILSAIIEKVSGMNFMDYLNQSFFFPLGIESVNLDNRDLEDPKRSKSYEFWQGVMYDERYANNVCKYGAGGLSASPESIVRFDLALLNGLLVDSATIELILSSMKLKNDEPTGYGFGLELETDSLGNFLAWHSGRSRGGRNGLVIYPKQKLVIMISANTNGDGIVNETEVVGRAFLKDLD